MKNAPDGTKPMTPPIHCAECGKPMPSGVLAGLCPACLLQAGARPDSGTRPGLPAFEPPAVAEVARLFPQLEVISLLGKGGMGAVYKARQPSLDRHVALKLLPALSTAGPDFVQRFNREARALARLHHPNIVAVHEFGQVNGHHYFIMEYVDGVNLRQLQKSGRLSPREALQLVPQICDALQYAHDEGVVHRDIKPENVLVDRKGRVRIADFGLAKVFGCEGSDRTLTGEGQVMGTPHYMAPEQVERPLEVDHRADIYSLGVVFYEMLTGELPLGRFAPPSRRVQVDVRLDEVVLHALEKEPALRYQQANEVKTAVTAIAESPGAAATPSRSSGPGTPLEYRTEASLFGIPLVHVVRDADPATGRPAVAKGIVAVGPTAIGVIAVGLRAFGLLPCGLIALGGAPVGLVAVGLLSTGLAAFGVQASGLLSVALHQAVGRLALAPEAIGGVAFPISAFAAALTCLLAGSAAWLLWRKTLRTFSATPPLPPISPEPSLIPMKLAAIGTASLLALLALVLVVARSTLLNFQVASRLERSPNASLSGVSETVLRSFDTGQATLSQELRPTSSDTWTLDSTSSNTFRLFEVTGLEVQNCTLNYEAVIKTEGMTGPVYLEMWCRFPGKGEFFSRGLNQTVSGSTDWTLCSTPFYLKDSDRPDLVRLNLVVGGAGKVQIRNVKLTATEQLLVTNTEVGAAGTPPDPKAEWRADPGLALRQARRLAEQGGYAAALERHLWYHENALKIDRALVGVRLSFALADWIELGRRYTPARRALVEIRDRKTQLIEEGQGYFDLFMDVAAINDHLEQPEATMDLFKVLHRKDASLARQCFGIAQPSLIQAGEFELCLAYLPNPEAEFGGIRAVLERDRNLARTNAQFLSPHFRQSSESRFTVQTLALIKVLTGTGQAAAAESIRAQAAVLVDDPRLKALTSTAASGAKE